MNKFKSPTRLTSLVKGGKWVVLILWIIVLVLTFPFIGKLSSTLDDSNELPASGQVQQVRDLQKQADPNAEEDDLSIVYENPNGLTPQDKQTIAAQYSQVTAANIEHVTSFSEVAYSPDGQAAYFSLLANVPNDNTTGPDVVNDIVTQVREIATATGDLTAFTTGTMAFDVDANSTDTDQILLLTAAIIVAILLILTYRSALLWVIPLFSAVLAISLTDMIVYLLTQNGLHVSSLDSSILIVLVFGVATDYGMLLISRYREYLHTHADKNEAVALALKGSFEAIAASAATVALALLALLFAEFSATKGLGPVAAIGVACAFLVQMTFLPAMLAIGGRVLLWPRAPKFVPDGGDQAAAGSWLWKGVSRSVSRYPHRITIGVTLLLLIGAFGLTQLSLSLSPTSGLRGDPPSVQGLSILEEHFTTLSGSPVIVVADTQASIQSAIAIAQQDAGTGTISSVGDLAGHPSITIEPNAVPYSDDAFAYIADLRADYAQAGLNDVIVGGDQAAQYDYTNITRRDNKVLIPIILLIVAVILGLLLRAIVAPILLLATVVLSFAGSFGLSVLIFNNLFHFESVDPALPIYIFLFVVALGVDYNIFLMDRARQETKLKGVREGILHSLTATGGVITAAGLVLAGTFAALAQIPIVNTTQVGVAVALGVLIDSFLVRSFLVPASVLTIGAKTWWPSKLSKPGPEDLSQRNDGDTSHRQGRHRRTPTREQSAAWLTPDGAPASSTSAESATPTRTNA